MEKILGLRGRWIGPAVLAAAGLLAALLACSSGQTESPPQEVALAVTNPAPTAVSLAAPRITRTPSNPRLAARVGLIPVLQAPAQPEKQPTPLPAPSLDFYRIDFTNQRKRVNIQIRPSGTQVNLGRPIIISFYPGDTCIFGDQHACISVFRTGNRQEVTFITVHSGVGGEGQAFRHAVEGSGLNQAAFTRKQVQTNLKALQGAAVTISQGKKTVAGFELVALTRIPAGDVDAYFALPVEEALKLAENLDPAFATHIRPDMPLAVFETCGWKMPGEPWAPGVSATTGSVYLGVIQKLH